jgi:hypothetical protein
MASSSPTSNAASWIRSWSGSSPGTVPKPPSGSRSRRRVEAKRHAQTVRHPACGTPSRRACFHLHARTTSACAGKEKPRGHGASLMRRRGLEPPRTIRSTRPSTSRIACTMRPGRQIRPSLCCIVSDPDVSGGMDVLKLVPTAAPRKGSPDDRLNAPPSRAREKPRPASYGVRLTRPRAWCAHARLSSKTPPSSDGSSRP